MTAAPFPIYHWSPARRRDQIASDGVVPGSLSVDESWRPPYTCWSDSPSLGWALSGQSSPVRGPWDLWMSWSNVPAGLVAKGDRPCEFRVFERITAGYLWHVGTREAA